MENKLNGEMRPDFANLLKQAHDARDEALGKLLEYYRPHLMRLASDAVDSDLCTKIAPSDLVQTLMCSATENFAEFRGTTPESFRRWLLSILQNEVIDSIRRFRAQKRNVIRETELIGDVAVEDDVSPCEILSQRELTDRLLCGIDRLDSRLKIVVRYRSAENLSFDEIGVRLRISRDSARRRWLSAIDRLRHLMEVSELIEQSP